MSYISVTTPTRQMMMSKLRSSRGRRHREMAWIPTDEKHSTHLPNNDEKVGEYAFQWQSLE